MASPLYNGPIYEPVEPYAYGHACCEHVGSTLMSSAAAEMHYEPVEPV